MIAVNGGILLSLCFFENLERKLFKLTSFFGFEASCDASCSCTRKLAISEHARMNRSFSGGRFRLFGFVCLSDSVIVSVAMLATVSVLPQIRGS